MKVTMPRLVVLVRARLTAAIAAFAALPLLAGACATQATPKSAPASAAPPPAAAVSPSEPQAHVVERATPCVRRTDLPAKSYQNKPEAEFGTSDYVAQFRHMEAFYDVPGEFGFIAEGERYGFESLSFIITETQPSGGPPLHTHESEEAHILLEGEVEYVIGDQRFAARGPYIARVPKGVPHTFANRGPCSFNLLAVFPSNKLTYKELGPNPLVPGAPDASKASGH
jgi:mannose-6-phosphate isomerase-like protein (cupin superfamily)